ncbi:hypothetical protein MTR67_022599 [Solanum verrucosum]|uniref:Reverse transcriptase RNase H-like domain-containing protein n=1 Tax=Solanum verrucosum TaxID=315347 RepID=A0AAF0TRF4_SOLVR|nr:hypothetical protein MTR67_022599 [Solanum verrucosum]
MTRTTQSYKKNVVPPFPTMVDELNKPDYINYNTMGKLRNKSLADEFRLINKEVTFNVCRSMKPSSGLQVVSMIDLVDEEQSKVSIEERLSVQTLAAMIMNFDEEDIIEYEEMVGALTAFEGLKEKFISEPIIITPDWTQKNDIVTQHGLLALVFAFKKFRSYLLGTKVIVHTDHTTLRITDPPTARHQDHSRGGHCGLRPELGCFLPSLHEPSHGSCGGPRLVKGPVVHHFWVGLREAGGLRDKDMISSSNIQNVAKFPNSQVALAQKHDMSDD